MNVSEERVRASDAEREQYAQIVREATGEGRLSLDEGDERLARVYAARFRDELPPLVGDLPAGRPSPGEGEVARRRGHVRRMRRRPYGPPLPALVALAGLVAVIWALTAGHAFFWPAVPLLFLAVVLLGRAWRWRRWH